MAGFRDDVARWTDEGASFELIAERIGRLRASEEDKWGPFLRTERDAQWDQLPLRPLRTRRLSVSG